MESDPKNAANAPQGVPSLAPPVAAPLSRAAIILIVPLRPEPQARASVRSFCGDLSGIFRAVEMRDLEAGLSCIMSIGSDAWDRLFGSPRPAMLHPFREIRARTHTALST